MVSLTVFCQMLTDTKTIVEKESTNGQSRKQHQEEEEATMVAISWKRETVASTHTQTHRTPTGQNKKSEEYAQNKKEENVF